MYDTRFSYPKVAIGKGEVTRRSNEGSRYLGNLTVAHIPKEVRPCLT